MAPASAASACCFCVSITSTARAAASSAARARRSAASALRSSASACLETLHGGRMLLRQDVGSALDRPRAPGQSLPSVAASPASASPITASCNRRCCIQVGERRLLAGNCGLGHRQRRAIVAVVELHQQIARMNVLVVGDRDLGDEAGDLRRDDGDVAADIGVVGAFDEASDRPPVMAVPGNPAGREQGSAEQAPSARPCRRPSLPRRRDIAGHGRQRSVDHLVAHDADSLS